MSQAPPGQLQVLGQFSAGQAGILAMVGFFQVGAAHFNVTTRNANLTVGHRHQTTISLERDPATEHVSVSQQKNAMVIILSRERGHEKATQ